MENVTDRRRSSRWQLVGFPGPGGRESAGIVDLLAIRKNHTKPKSPFKRGDLFEIILIQIKGGGRNDRTKTCLDMTRTWNQNLWDEQKRLDDLRGRGAAMGFRLGSSKAISDATCAAAVSVDGN
jgi:hypothetical protein